MIRISFASIVLLALANPLQAGAVFRDPIFGVQTTSNITYDRPLGRGEWFYA